MSNINKPVIILILGLILAVNNSCSDNVTSSDPSTSNRDITSTRTPGEWEEQEAIWLQWPNNWDSKLRLAFVSIITVVQQYETVNLIVRNETMKSQVTQMFQDQNITLTNVNFHFADYENAWLRDNGPVYVFDKNNKWVLDFGFDGWGSGLTGDIEYTNDNIIPGIISTLLECEYENNNGYILERGNLEANSENIVMLNWDCQSDRNPDWSKEQTDAYFQEKFGITKVIWVEGHDPYDITTGHIDGTARFVNDSTVVVAQVDPSIETYSGEALNLDKIAEDIEAAGIAVIRFTIPGWIIYEGTELPVMYMNYLVGNGFVLGMAFGNAEWDNNAKSQLETLYPTRTVHMIEVNALWNSGGGIHCVTNDEPILK
ncbi:MAG: agmatine deiminase family protein [Calditrichaeota bacterium]|nr:agmatine deiminase family protein [Calditrichota bacterium]MBT7787266.1 agmatine deiminase family protein [Calditrichota bacterium]